MTQPADRDDDRIEQQLLEIEDNPQAAHETTIANLHKDLETLAHDLGSPAPADPHEGESACQRAVQNVQTLASRDTVIASGAATGLPSNREPGTVLGQYRILGKLGQGGMGAVYKALHTKLEKTVALKVLPEDRLGKSDAIARFHREMKAVGKIEHPHLVRALDAGEADGSHYLVMEYVDGIDLSRLLKEQGRLPVAAACELIRQAALGLQAAHQSGMVHRDIKPANLMLARQDFGPPSVKVLDLGLARLADGSGQMETELTTDNQIMGTLDFMAPEQADSSKDVDTRADVYSLGATLFTLLTGQPPYHSAAQQTFIQKLNALATAPLPNMQNLRADVPAGLATVLEKMLAKDRGKRYREPGEVAKALEPFTANANLATLLEDAKTQPSLSMMSQSTATWAVPSTSPTVLIQKPFRKRPALLAGIALLILAPLAYLYAGTIIRFATNQGELVIEVDDPNIEVQIVQNGAVVKDKTKDREFTLTASDGQIKVLDNDGLDVLTKEFQLTRGGKTIVKVSKSELPDPTKPNPIPPIDSTDPDRYAAEWLVRQGNKFFCRDSQGKFFAVERLDQIPSLAFRITSVGLYAAPPPTEAEFASLKDLKELGTLAIYNSLSRNAWDQLPLFLHLTILEFYPGSNVTDQDLGILRRLPRLRNLSLYDTAITNQAGPHLEQLTNLTGLNLHAKLDDGILEHVAKLEALESLGLYGRSVSDEGLSLLKSLPRLRGLSLYDTAITNQAGPHLEQHKYLGQLNLASTKVDDAILDHLAKLKMLYRLDLSYTSVTDKGLPLLHRMTKLKQVVLSGTEVTEAGVKALAAALPQCEIVWDGGVVEPRTESSDADRKVALWVLSKGGEVYVNGGLERIGEAAKLPQAAFRLSGLELTGDVVDASEFEILADTKSLTRLSLSGAGITEEVLARFQETPALTHLTLDGPGITEQGLAAFQNCKKLTHLALGGPGMTSVGLAHFKECKELTHLVLRSPGITGSGLKQFENAKNLTQLVIESPGISDAELPTLEKFLKLTHLDLRKTRFTETGVKHLASALPNCKIEWNGGTAQPENTNGNSN